MRIEEIFHIDEEDYLKCSRCSSEDCFKCDIFQSYFDLLDPADQVEIAEAMGYVI